MITISMPTQLLLLALKESNTKGKKTTRKASGCCRLHAGDKSLYLLAPGLIGNWAPLSARQTKERNLSPYADETVKRIVRTSLSFKYIKKSKDENLKDVSLSTCAGNVLCHLRSAHGRKALFTQSELIKIIVIAAKDMLEDRRR
jgi:hypothetical protein